MFIWCSRLFKVEGLRFFFRPGRHLRGVGYTLRFPMEKKSPFGEDGKREDVWLRFVFLRNHLLVVVVPGNHRKVPCFLF